MARNFWFIVMVGCMVWYSTITIFVAIRGAMDIRDMFRRLGTDAELEDQA